MRARLRPWRNAPATGAAFWWFNYRNMTAPTTGNLTKSLWPMMIMVVIFLVALWIASKARRQEITLSEQPDGTYKGTISEGWFVKSQNPQNA